MIEREREGGGGTETEMGTQADRTVKTDKQTARQTDSERDLFHRITHLIQPFP